MRGFKRAVSQAAVILFSLNPLVGGHALALEWQADPQAVPDARVSELACIYSSTTLYGGPTEVGWGTIAYGPYTANCAGVHRGYLKNLSSAWLDLELQKLVNGTWVYVSSGGYTSYSGTAGTYRWIVWNDGNGTGYWSLDVNTPL